MLKITAKNLPTGMPDKILHPSVSLVEDILNRLGYKKGDWVLNVTNRKRHKTEEKFKFVHQEDNYVRIRLKPKGNDSCFEWALTPPHGTDLAKLATALQTVHPKQLSIPTVRPDEQEEKENPANKPKELWEPQPLPQPHPLLCNTVQKCTNKAVEVVATPDVVFYVCADHITTTEWMGACQTAKRQWGVKEEASKLKPAKPEPKPENVEIKPQEVLEEKTLGLAVPHDTQSLTDPIAINQGLVAACMVLDSHGSGKRTDVTASIAKHLCLDEYVLHTKKYNTVNAAVRAIISGLCNRGFLSRFPYKSRSRNSTSTGTTEGYILTPHGREQLAFLQQSNLLPEELASRMFKGPYDERKEEEITVADVLAEEGVEIEMEAPQTKSTSPTTKAKILELHPLVEKHDKLIGEIAEIEEEISAVVSQQELQQTYRKGVEAQIEEQNKEIEKIQAKIAGLEGIAEEHDEKMAALQTEIDTWEAEKRNRQSVLQKIATELRAKGADL